MEPDFIPARHEFWTELFFGWYIRWSIFFHFQALKFHWVEDSSKLGLKSSYLIFSNHYSWWDALYIYYGNQILFKKKFHCMVLKDTLLKNKTLSKVGGFSIQPGTRSALKSLEYAGKLLNDSSNLVLFFPQGELESNHQSSISFKSGSHRLIKDVPKNTQILLMAGFLDYFSKKKPEITLYVKALEISSNISHIEEIYHDFYTKARNIQGLREQ